ncbi:STAS domain-containing protein [Nocardioides sp. GCM10027113]|uniref:STAS domain-containing protein n=1 Tax=unclassified Nocardioides TaxID=2615069 RepID=UPI00360A41E3
MSQSTGKGTAEEGGRADGWVAGGAELMVDGSTLVLCGDLDVRSTPEVRTALYDLLASCEGDVAVDLTGVTAIDLTALKVLAMATREAGHEGRHLVLRGCGPAVRRMLHLSRLIRLVEVDRAAATA